MMTKAMMKLNTNLFIFFSSFDIHFCLFDYLVVNTIKENSFILFTRRTFSFREDNANLVTDRWRESLLLLYYHFSVMRYFPEDIIVFAEENILSGLYVFLLVHLVILHLHASSHPPVVKINAMHAIPLSSAFAVAL